MRTRSVPAFVTAGIVLWAASASAQVTKGGIGGRVTDAYGNAVSGATVIAAGPQGEEPTLSDDKGDYVLDSLTVGTYVLRVYPPGAATSVDHTDVEVSAGKTVRVNVRAGSGEAIVSETVVVTQQAPSLDLGTSHTGLTLKSPQLRNLPLGRTYADVLTLAPGAFIDRAGNVSIGGASGLENRYLVNGLNVGGLEFGDVMTDRSNASGGSNLPLEFVEELQIQTGGYSAEYGGSMGGAINVVTKSGSNQFRGSVFSLWTPSSMIGTPRTAPNLNSVLVGKHVQGDELNFGVEVGGPIIKDRLFFWAGFAPRLQTGHFDRSVLGRVDADGDGVADTDANGKPVTNLLGTSRMDEHRRTYAFGTKITYLLAPEHKLDLSLFGSPTRTQSAFREAGPEAVSDLRSITSSFQKDNTDLIAAWTSHLLDRRWKLEASAGLHIEGYRNRSPYRDMNNRNQLELYGASLWDIERTPGCQPTGGFDPCPVNNYHAGGFGLNKRFDANRKAVDLKSTHIFGLLGRHELKYGTHLEFNQFELQRNYTGPLGNRELLQVYPDNTIAWSLFSLPRDRYPNEFAGDKARELRGSPFYQDQLIAKVKSDSQAVFLQDAYSPLPNLTISAGLRFERQNLYDYFGNRFAQLDNWGPRVGAIWDPTNDGRSKVFANFGRFYESVPLNLAARYFGGEGILTSSYDTASCPTPPLGWKGTGGEHAGCKLNGVNQYNNGSLYPVQPRLRGQFHDEIVGGVERELAKGTVFGATFTRRWLGSVIEDGTTADGTFVLANPGNIPDRALSDVQSEIARKERQVNAAEDPSDKAARENELGALKSKLANLQGLAISPKPERTYTAMTLTASKRLTRHLSLYTAYTYSRLYGNYNGLYDADNNYAAPNGNNSYDTPELTVNRRGPLANDRPHSIRMTAFYDIPTSRGTFVLGSVFSAFSGVPRNHMAALIPGQQLVMLLPRGSAGRTPTVTQVDARLGWRRGLSQTVSMELFVELFNVLNTRTALLMDDDYTYDMTAPVKNGTTDDLPFARNISGQPIAVNPNFGQAIAFQAPIHGRLGLRILF